MSRGVHRAVMLPTIVALLIATLLSTRWAFAERQVELSIRAENTVASVAANVQRVMERDVSAVTALTVDLGDPLELASADWHAMVERTWRAGAFREVAAVNLATWLDAQDATALAAQRDAEGAPFELRLGPEPPHAVLVHVWPQQGNVRALGFDVTSFPESAEVIRRVEVSGAPLASAPLELVQETQGQRATVVYVPITVEGETVGFANLAFRAGAVLERVRPTGQQEATLRWTDVRTGEELAVTGSGASGAVAHAQLASYGPLWRVEAEVPLAALPASERSVPWLIALLGSVLTAAVAAAAVSSTRATRRAERLAEQRGRDLAERAEQLRSANEQLQELHDTKDRVMRSVTHDLRNPITVAGGLAGVLLDHDPPEEQRRDLLARIAHQATRLEAMVDELATTSRIQDGQVRAQPVVVDLGEVARRVVADVGTGRVVPPPAPVPAVADPLHVERILTNLLTNARRYGGEPIEVSLQAVGGRAEIRVRDHGPGIAAADRDRIFQEFTRLRPQGDGLGLGLAISAGLARVNDGDLALEHPDDGGACFVLRLPGVPAPGAGAVAGAAVGEIGAAGLPATHDAG